MPVLTLLDDVRWQGTVVPGDRPRALLAALAAQTGRPVSDERLIELVWGEDVPANATKSLQVLVSRTRTACGADAIVRDAAGYRLGVDPADVDAARLAGLARDAARALDDDAPAAAELAREALALAAGLEPADGGPDDPLTALRRSAAGDVTVARTVLAQAESRTGAHAAALPALESAHAQRPDDEALLADLLRSEAAVRGPGAALERYEEHRRDLLERLGTNPGERLQRVHRDLLALDRPERSGVRYDATSLVGREEDVAALRALLAGARVVSIVGAGGLGKTRLAHVLARDATQPVVHVVELVGVTAAEDVVGEVGSVLGVRDSVSARRTLSAAQRADVRGRISQLLGQSPSLLVLDNCEHLVAAVAELVAFLVATTPDLRVLTTSRAPLAISAERVYLLGELGAEDAAALFRERAVAARPRVRLAEAAVASIVGRLDGLPLAIELAAAKVRAMTVEEIDRRLENRFALLRGGDRSAPDRHRTLLAVIDWSWNLLGEAERRALRRLALFNDGFTLDAADAVLGEGALDAVQGLVDQSLLGVREDAGRALRYRMLETVREFGLMQLVDAGEDDEAREARRSWLIAYAARHGPRLLGAAQFDAIDAVAAEDVNLTDELREALADGDPATVVRLLATLGLFWTIRGDHARLMAVTAGVAEVVRDWVPPAEVEETARAAATLTLTTALATAAAQVDPIRDLLARLGPGASPRLAALGSMLLEYDPEDPAAFPARLALRAEDPDPDVALPALQWLGHLREHGGDPVGAWETTERALALAGDRDGPWMAAILHAQMAMLATQTGDPAGARDHAGAALPVLQRLGALDDELQLRTLLVLCAIAERRLDDAEEELGHIDAIDGHEALFGGFAFRRMAQAELAIARGDRVTGLRVYRDGAARMVALRLPGIESDGTEPWAMLGEAVALAAHAHYAQSPDDVDRGRVLFGACRDRTLRALDPGNRDLDHPVAGTALFALGAWVLLRSDVARADGAMLLALAERLTYNRMIPTMAWERIEPIAQQRAPGAIPGARAAVAGRPAPELLGEARAVLARLPG